ncbi:MAG: SDR family NAD(P)-dependent oxidoreductase [Bacteroidetes bacterium]|nr:SDR family NAD(P)-dependent oxidoreductase [Bacteroidota bacterium]
MNKNVFITGASSGIGEACAHAFAYEGANLIISARRFEKVEELANVIREKYDVKVLALKIDVTDYGMVEKAVSELTDEWKNIDILINNAGKGLGLEKMYEDDPNSWDEMIDTNIKGALYVIKAVVPGMVERKSGHVINLGSIAGHEPYPKGGVYCATKHALDAITKSLRMDVIDKNVKVSTIDPGMVETNFGEIRFYGDKEKAANVYKGVKPLVAEDIAETIVFIATRPAHVNINEIIIMPHVQANPFVCHREE